MSRYNYSCANECGDEYIVKRNPNMIEIPENATNGDMVKLIFGITSKDMKWKCRGQKWWNTPYKREGDGE